MKARIPKITQKDIANEIGFSDSTIKMYINGEKFDKLCSGKIFEKRTAKAFFWPSRSQRGILSRTLNHITEVFKNNFAEGYSDKIFSKKIYLRNFNNALQKLELIVSIDKCVGEDTLHDLKDFVSQSKWSQAKIGKDLESLLWSIKKAYLLLGDGFIKIYIEHAFL